MYLILWQERASERKLLLILSAQAWFPRQSRSLGPLAWSVGTHVIALIVEVQ